MAEVVLARSASYSTGAQRWATQWTHYKPPDSRYDARLEGFLHGLVLIGVAILGGLGVAVISTPQGIMSDAQARAAGTGGEVLFVVQ